LENDSKIMHPAEAKICARTVHFEARFFACFGSISHDIFRGPREQARRLNCHRWRSWKRLFHGLVLFCFLRDAFHYKYKPCIRWILWECVENKTLCRKQGLEANIQTRVCREFLLATNTRVEIVSIHLEQNTIRIKSLGHGKRLWLWVELGFKTNSCNPQYLFVKKLRSL